MFNRWRLYSNFIVIQTHSLIKTSVFLRTSSIDMVNNSVVRWGDSNKKSYVNDFHSESLTDRLE